MLTAGERRLDAAVLIGFFALLLLIVVFGRSWARSLAPYLHPLIIIWMPLGFLVTLVTAMFVYNWRGPVRNFRRVARRTAPETITIAVHGDLLTVTSDRLRSEAPLNKIDAIFVTRRAVGLLAGDMVMPIAIPEGTEQQARLIALLDAILAGMQPEARERSKQMLRNSRLNFSSRGSS